MTPSARAPRLWLGLALIAASWPLNWADALWSGAPRTHLLFFPLWLGYVLVVDAWCELRAGTSAWRRSRSGFVLRFVLSAPAWWLFELLNLRLSNWEYVGREHFTALEYALLCTLSFSTVLPAVLGTAELVRTFPFIERFARGPRWSRSPRKALGYFVLGLSMLIAMLVQPDWFYPFCWTSLVFLLEALAHALGRRGLSDDLARGDWRPWWSLWIGGLACGFFWELWNVWSYPKWVYHVPGVEFAYLFEMPALGYLGYLPFAMEVYLFANLVLPERARAGMGQWFDSDSRRHALPF